MEGIIQNAIVAGVVANVILDIWQRVLHVVSPALWGPPCVCVQPPPSDPTRTVMHPTSGDCAQTTAKRKGGIHSATPPQVSLTSPTFPQ